MASAGLATGAIDVAAAGLAVYAAWIVLVAGLLPRPGRRQLAWAGPHLVGLWAGIGVVGRCGRGDHRRAHRGRAALPWRWLVVLVLSGYGQILLASLAYVGPVLQGGGHERLTRNFSMTRSPLGLAAATPPLWPPWPGWVPSWPPRWRGGAVTSRCVPRVSATT